MYKTLHFLPKGWKWTSPGTTQNFSIMHLQKLFNSVYKKFPKWSGSSCRQLYIFWKVRNNLTYRRHTKMLCNSSFLIIILWRIFKFDLNIIETKDKFVKFEQLTTLGNELFIFDNYRLPLYQQTVLVIHIGSVLLSDVIGIFLRLLEGYSVIVCDWKLLHLIYNHQRYTHVPLSGILNVSGDLTSYFLSLFSAQFPLKLSLLSDTSEGFSC